MGKLRSWGLAAALAVGLGAQAACAGDDESDSKPSPRPSSGHWVGPFASLNTPPKRPAKKPAKVDKKTDDKPVPQIDEAALDRARAEAALLRRLDACTRLMEIAWQTNDNELLKKAEELDERARAVYVKRTGYWAAGEVADAGTTKEGKR